MLSTSLSKRYGRSILLVLLLGLVAFGTTACEEALDGGFGSTISSFTISPDRIPQSDTGMTDEFFDVSMTVSGFETPVSSVELFIQETGQQAPLNSERELSVVGSSVSVSNIAKTWFNGVSPGIYNIGATVTAEDGSEVTQRNLGTVEVF
jgi:hypothetical protein